MSKEKRRVPKLRFPGFTEDWEQRKLSQFTARVTRKNGGQSDLPLTISAQDGLVDQRKYFNRQVASRDMSNYYLIKKGEFAYNKSYSEGYPFGAVKRLNYYDIGALSTLYILFEITDKNISSDFIVSYYMTHLWYKEISKRAAEGARNHGLLNISTEDFFDSELNIPNSIEEQVKIGNFIKEFDKFITLHQRKLDNLKLKKKALLQKLFPKNGERNPELRFPGFTDAWEQCKLGDVVKSYSGGTPTASNKEYYGGDIPFIRSAEINSDTTELYITQEGLDNSSAKIVDKGTILYAMYGATSGEVGISKINGAINQAILAMIPLEYNSRIIAQYLRKNKESIIGKYLQGGQGNLSANIILELPIQLPGLEESNQIANFLESFDNIITLHQRKLDHLKLQKKALLQQMFV